METKTIEIKGATIVSTSGNPAEGEPTTVLVIEAPMTLAMADVLKCRFLYTLNDQPVRFEGKMRLPLELGEDEGELTLTLSNGGQTTMRPLKIHAFTVSHINELQLGLGFRSHFKGAEDAQDINDFLYATNKAEFTCWVGSTQGELFPEVLAGDGPEGGKRVDMSGPSTGEETNGKVTMTDAVGKVLFEGTSKEFHEAATLASAREANGGTHAKRSRRSEAAVQ